MVNEEMLVVLESRFGIAMYNYYFQALGQFLIPEVNLNLIA